MSVTSGDRLNSFVSGIKRATPVAALLLGYFRFTLPNVGLTNSLLILTVVMLAVQSLVVYLSKRDADDGFESVEGSLKETRNAINDGFETLEEAIDGMGSSTTTDGGWNVNGDREPRSTRIEVDLEDASGAGALSGLVAGGALGAPFGPAGVIVGGVLGGLLGNSVEYRNLKQEQKGRLRTAVREFVASSTPPQTMIVGFDGVSEGQGERGAFWIFKFVDEHGKTHAAKLYPDDGHVVLVE